MKITLEMSAQRQREVLYFLRRRYRKPRAKLRGLVEVAVLKEVAAQANDDLEKHN